MALSNSAVGSQSFVGVSPSSLPGPTERFVQFAQGQFTCNGATAVTVANALVTANSNVLVTLATAAGTVGAIPAVKTITPGTGFTIAGTASDTSVYNYLIIG